MEGQFCKHATAALFTDIRHLDVELKPSISCAPSQVVLALPPPEDAAVCGKASLWAANHDKACSGRHVTKAKGLHV